MYVIGVWNDLIPTIIWSSVFFSPPFWASHHVRSSWKFYFYLFRIITHFIQTFDFGFLYTFDGSHLFWESKKLYTDIFAFSRFCFFLDFFIRRGSLDSYRNRKKRFWKRLKYGFQSLYFCSFLMVADTIISIYLSSN